MRHHILSQPEFYCALVSLTFLQAVSFFRDYSRMNDVWFGNNTVKRKQAIAHDSVVSSVFISSGYHCSFFPICVMYRRCEASKACSWPIRRLTEK